MGVLLGALSSRRPRAWGSATLCPRFGFGALRFRVKGFGFRISDSGLAVSEFGVLGFGALRCFSSGFGVWDLGGLGFRASGLGFGVWGLEFGV